MMRGTDFDDLQQTLDSLLWRVKDAGFYAA